MWKTDPGRNVLYLYSIKCSIDEEENIGNELTTKRSTAMQHITHKFSRNAANMVYRVLTSSVAIPLYQCKTHAH